jgi:hypothetical protein
MNDDNKENRPNTSNMGLVIVLGTRLGVVFGEFVFDNVAVGIVVGAALGIAFSKLNRRK